MGFPTGCCSPNHDTYSSLPNESLYLLKPDTHRTKYKKKFQKDLKAADHRIKNFQATIKSLGQQKPRAKKNIRFKKHDNETLSAIDIKNIRNYLNSRNLIADSHKLKKDFYIINKMVIR